MGVYSGKEVGAGYNHDVGIILANGRQSSLLGYNPVSDRIIVLRLSAHPYNMTIVQIYSPTSTANEEELDQFYETLQETIDAIPARDVKIIMGDANAKVGKATTAAPTHRVFGLGEQNEQGHKLIYFCGTNNHTITNTLFSNTLDVCIRG